ncbi:MAG TPA: glutathione S-transferase [Caulobacteraceae bacterium]|jgi:glutathione S-transferase|nr:glutathione S-transferase [Caulobacteraceae bacterium]
MKLYDSRLAPNPRRFRWFMAEKGIDDIEVVDVDLMTGAHRTPEYVGRAGIAQAPALTMDCGTTITESIAICRYLESVYPEPNLFGRDAKEIAVIEMWMRRAEMLAAIPLMLAVRHGHPALAALETQVPEVAANNRGQAERSLSFFDRRLGESEWIGADRITIADGVLYIGMEFARLVRFKVPENLANLTRWQAAMRERSSATAGT